MNFNQDLLANQVRRHEDTIRALQAQMDTQHTALLEMIEGMNALRDLIAIVNRKVEAG
jgi:phage shock protein A